MLLKCKFPLKEKSLFPGLSWKLHKMSLEVLSHQQGHHQNHEGHTKRTQQETGGGPQQSGSDHLNFSNSSNCY